MVVTFYLIPSSSRALGLQWRHKVSCFSLWLSLILFMRFKIGRFLKTWNSLSKQIHGALFVTSADGKLDKELDAWYDEWWSQNTDLFLEIKGKRLYLTLNLIKLASLLTKSSLSLRRVKANQVFKEWNWGTYMIVTPSSCSLRQQNFGKVPTCYDFTRYRARAYQNRICCSLIICIYRILE